MLVEFFIVYRMEKETMTINEYIKKYRNIKELKDFRGTSMESHYEDGIMRRVMNPHVICNDDFSFSAQASETHYSQPKGLADEYEKIEIGYPSYDDPIISEYREDFGWEDSPMTNAVYGYVPVEIVDKLIAAHGGINEDAVQESIKELEEAA